jgi:2,3-bisphosphoglycerate-independent phosphoglycerate mutase
MNFLFIFIDGVGLGTDDPLVNPIVRASTPHLDALLGGKKIIANGRHPDSIDGNYLLKTSRASLLSLDACLGIDGLPQSASGQASLLTGKNVPRMLGYHDGPKPSPEIIEILQGETIFSLMSKQKRKASLLNAYPPRYFLSIENGYRLPGAIALSAKYAGVPLKTQDDLFMGDAISTDFTAQGWHDHLGIKDTPLLNPHQAGERLHSLSVPCDLSFFEYWLTDIAGHHQDMEAATHLLELFDSVLGNLADFWDDEKGLIIVTSDHGNLEDLSTRRHTRNDVPLLLIGSPANRGGFIDKLNQASGIKGKLDLTDITPAILNLYETSI